MNRKEIQINLTVEDGEVVAMDMTENTFNRVEYVGEYEGERLKKIDVLQIFHSIADEYIK